LFGIELHFAALPNAWPMEFTLVQAACRQPNTNPIVYQHFHASPAAIGKQISGFAAPNTAITLTRAVSVPARISMCADHRKASTNYCELILK